MPNKTEKVRPMRKRVVVTIKGVQRTDGEESTTELFTQADFYKRNNSYYIIYAESEATGYDGCFTTVKIDPNNKVTMMRKGTMTSHLVAELGRRSIGYYDTAAGELQIGTFTKELTSSVDDNGGDLYFSYNLDVNSSEVSENEVYINIKEHVKER